MIVSIRHSSCDHAVGVTTLLRRWVGAVVGSAGTVIDVIYFAVPETALWPTCLSDGNASVTNKNRARPPRDP